MHDRAEGPSRGFCCADHRQRWRAVHEDALAALETWADIDICKVDPEFTMEYAYLLPAPAPAPAPAAGDDDAAAKAAKAAAARRTLPKAATQKVGFSMNSMKPHIEAVKAEHEALYNAVAARLAAEGAIVPIPPEDCAPTATAAAGGAGAMVSRLQPGAGGAEEYTLRRLFVGAVRALPALARLAAHMAAAAGGRHLAWSLKKCFRVWRKVHEKYNGSFARVGDVARCAVQFRSMAPMRAALRWLRANAAAFGAEVLIVKDRFRAPADGGYRDVLIGVRFRGGGGGGDEGGGGGSSSSSSGGGDGAAGHVCEIQLHLAQIYELKKSVGHQAYKWMRKLPKAANVYEGERDEATGLFHGKGTLMYASGNAYYGHFAGGKKQGWGTYVYASGDTYVGDFVADVFHGSGRYAYRSGNVYDGAWQRGVKEGAGRMEYYDGKVYAGMFHKGKPHGLGTQLARVAATEGDGGGEGGEGGGGGGGGGGGKLVVVFEGRYVNGKAQTKDAAVGATARRASVVQASENVLREWLRAHKAEDEQARSLYVRLFEQFDSDGNGMLSKAEFAQGFERLGADFDFAPQDIEMVIREFHAQHGVVDRAAFVRFLAGLGLDEGE